MLRTATASKTKLIKIRLVSLVAADGSLFIEILSSFILVSFRSQWPPALTRSLAHFFIRQRENSKLALSNLDASIEWLNLLKMRTIRVFRSKTCGTWTKNHLDTWVKNNWPYFDVNYKKFKCHHILG